jgi:zinc finger FYVE domain-containing protein 26
VELFDLIRKCVQLAHVDAMKECSKEGDEGVFSHIRFLHLDRGLEESEYRYVHFWVSVI